MAHTIKNAGGQDLAVKTFHEHGATEIRATVLVQLLFANEIRVSDSEFQIVVRNRAKKVVADVKAPTLDKARALANAAIVQAKLEWRKRVDIHLLDAEGHPAFEGITLNELLGYALDEKHRDGAKVEIGPGNISDFKPQPEGKEKTEA